MVTPKQMENNPLEDTPWEASTRSFGPESLERAMGIEPTSEAWEASILPLYDARFWFAA